MVEAMVAMVDGPAVAGSLPVRIGATVRSLVCDRQVAATAARNDQALVVMSGGTGWVICLLSSTPGTSTPTVQPSAPLPERSDVLVTTDPIPPTWTGTWRGGRWLTDRNDLGQGDYGWGLNWGAAFYGRGLRALRLLTGTTVRVRREPGGVFGAQTPTMLLLGSSTLGATFPAVLATAPGPSLSLKTGETREAQWPVPAGWLPRLGVGGDAGGIGIGINASTPYMWIDGPSMVVTARHERTAA